MDVSDVAYDAFLVNGQRRQALPARPGETIRLRVINAAAASYFYLSSATGPFTIIAADGIDVAPIKQNRLLVGMAETYDVLVTVPADGPSAAWEVRATTQDNSGHASLFLGEAGASKHLAPAPGPLNPYSMDAALGAILDEMDESGDVTDDEALAAESDRPLPPYKRLRATRSTALPADAPTREITLRLTGDMWRYLWSINGQTMSEQSTLPVKKGEVLRLVLANDTMMHHPMHLHGHFFRLLMPDGAPLEYAPLKHTVDVPPMSRRVIEFEANEDKDWLFHCHLLYHHKTGMARVFSYAAGEQMRAAGTGQSADETYRPNLGEHAHEHTYAWVDGNVLSHLSQGLATLQRGRQNLNLGWELGWERVPRREYEIDANYSHYFNPRWTAFAGYRLTNLEGGKDCVIAGATYRLPYLVDPTVTLQSDGEARLAAGREIPLTSRLSLIVRAEYDTEQDFDWPAGLSYTLSKQLSLIGTYDADHGLDAGFGFSF